MSPATTAPAPGRPRARLLREPGPFRVLWSARTISYIGDGVSHVALVVLAARHGATGVGLVLLANTIPRFLGPVAGALADRADRRRLMLACEIGQGALMALIAITLPSLGVLLALVAGMGLCATLFGPASTSVLPALVGPAALTRANAMLGTALNLQVTAGPALGGLLVAAGGTRTALAADAATFAVSALLLTRLPSLRAGRAPGPATGVIADTRAGLAYVTREPVPRALVVALLIYVAFAAVDNVALLFLVRDHLGGSTADFGFAQAAFGGGMLAASLGLGVVRRAPRPARLLLGGLVVGSVGATATALAPVLGLAAAGQVIAGAGNGIDNIALASLVQLVVPTALLGRVWGVVGSAAQAGSGVAYAAGGPLVALTSPQTAFLVGGLGSLLALPVLASALRRPVRSSAPARR